MELFSERILLGLRHHIAVERILILILVTRRCIQSRSEEGEFPCRACFDG